MNFRTLTDTAHGFPVAVTTYNLWDLAKRHQMPLDEVVRAARDYGVPIGRDRITEAEFLDLHAMFTLEASCRALKSFDWDMTDGLSNYF